MTVSDHAYRRARKRLRWRREVLDKMAAIALRKGIKHKDANGRLKRYITKEYKRYERANNIRIYGHNIYLFHNQRLMTIYQVPTEMVKYVEAVG